MVDDTQNDNDRATDGNGDSDMLGSSLDWDARARSLGRK